MIWTDPSGQAWEVLYLTRGIDMLTESMPPDATHRGFRSGELRRVYAFRRGDDRSEDPQTIELQFLASKRTRSLAQWIAQRGRVVSNVGSRSDAVAAVYDMRRGMGKR